MKGGCARSSSPSRWSTSSARSATRRWRPPKRTSSNGCGRSARPAARRPRVCGRARGWWGWTSPRRFPRIPPSGRNSRTKVDLPSPSPGWWGGDGRGGQGVRFLFFGGKGGVGKTTCAAAAALRHAEATDSGRRVLLVSTDPAHSLGDALDVDLGPEPVQIPTRRGRLLAAELDAESALGRWLGPRRADLETIAERGTWLDRDDVSRFLDLGLPGVDELAGLLELMRLVEASPGDEVVVDTAPTAPTLRLLAMPGELRRFARALDDLQARHRAVA